MSQSDMNIANQGFPAFRADLNAALAALVSNSSGATAPSDTFPHQFWVDTSANPSVLKQRNLNDDAWVSIGTINETTGVFSLTPGSVDIAGVDGLSDALDEKADQATTYTKTESDSRRSGKIQPVTASVASSALTVTINPTTLDFRSSTLGSGTVNTRNIGTALSAVVPSGATLGATNATLSRVMILAIDNAGTVEVAVCNGSLALDESTLISTTALSADADSASVIYSTTARTNVPFRIVGFVESTQSTAGTWASAPSKIQGVGGQIRQASNSSLTRSTAVTASGTAVDFTGIPSWVKRITVMFSGVSTNGVSNPIIRIGTSGGVDTSGYDGSSVSALSGGSSVGGTSAVGFSFAQGTWASTAVAQGSYVLLNIGGNVWVGSGLLVRSDSAVGLLSAGSKTLSGVLDRIRITAANGTDSFDSGTINLLIEG